VSYKFVMAGLVPAIHVLLSMCRKDVDARHKAGHDEKSKAKTYLAGAAFAERSGRFAASASATPRPLAKQA
jgi:hypothetical protein